MTTFDLNIVPKKWTYRPFEESFSDLVTLLKLLMNSNSEDESALGQAVRSASFQLLEAVGNSLLFAVPSLSEKTKKQIEHFKIFDKFDFLCSTKTNKPLDPSVFNAILPHSTKRNQKTHPKPLSTTCKSVSKNENEIFFFETEDIPPKTSKETGLVLVIEIMKFLDHFLLDICKCNPTDLEQLLQDFALMPNGQHFFFFESKDFFR